MMKLHDLERGEGRSLPPEVGIYLDANASTQPLPEVIEAVGSAMACRWHNASSGHGPGRSARAVLEAGRDAVELLLGGVRAEDVIFTSGGTEANNIAIGWADEATTILTSSVEHAAIAAPALLARSRGAALVVLPVGAAGVVDPDALRRELGRVPGKVLVSIQWANGETGVVQPVAEFGGIVAGREGAAFHCDAAQAVGRMPIDLHGARIHSLAFSGHKLHGPAGIGVLALSDPAAFTPPPLILGGGQEGGVRSGTPAVPLAAGLATALRARAAALGAFLAHMAEMRDDFERQLLDLVPDARVNGGSSPRVCNTSSIRVPGVDGMALVANLDAAGVYCSQASACSSARPEPSQVLTAMGLPAREAFECVRFSFSVLNTGREAAAAARAVASTVRHLRGVKH